MAGSIPIGFSDPPGGPIGSPQGLNSTGFYPFVKIFYNFSHRPIGIISVKKVQLHMVGSQMLQALGEVLPEGIPVQPGMLLFIGMAAFGGNDHPVPSAAAV